MATKKCTGPCGQTLPLNKFGKDRSRPDGYTTSCRKCRNTRRKELLDADRAAFNASRRQKYAKSPEKRRIVCNQWKASNREKVKAANKRRRDANPDKGWITHIKNAYDMSPEQYYAMHDKQNGVCAVCKQPETTTHKGKVRRLAIDHDHETGEVRGLLCTGCNTGIGGLKDDPERLKAAIDYLKNPPASN